MDLNQLDFNKGIYKSEDQQDNSHVQDLPVSIQSLEESIIEELSKFNIEMTDALIAAAKDISARSALNSCQFARTRMTALKIINDFQTLIVQQQLQSVSSSGNGNPVLHIHENLVSVLISIYKIEAFVLISKCHYFDQYNHLKLQKTVLEKTASGFLLMEQDLHRYEEAKHGNAAMGHLSSAMKHFNKLQKICQK